MFQIEIETTLAVALQTDNEKQVRESSIQLANWLDNALIYIRKGYRVFVFVSYGCHQWKDEMRELYSCLRGASEDNYAVLLTHRYRKQSGAPDKFRLTELL